ncbi:methionine--tRNA ligase [Psychrobacillus sp. INOP01]|uniref:methionine--tRNA ligase n=1 Tax=Psychrobacillus sp. INOP01 TaxID=2829187 RepID=UPI001BA9670D|nr:methionine--tRNA ligase [Psychrobacillus sp. INOP01]QUG42041.1 methionine--tRNA ligase [Psychrobacillus sp. INOP01]
MSIFIGGAWPYANGSLHLGHIAALLPGDILARYFRLKGEDVLYVSGSDCNGTPISIRANKEGIKVKEVADRYHFEFEDSFRRLGFSYDLYTRTDSENHHQVVKGLFLKLLDNGFIYKKEIEQTYCEEDKQFLPDRYVEGKCPNCGSGARGDQCDNCSKILDPLDLIDRTCKLCGNEPTIRKTEHFYFKLSAFQEQLEDFVQKAKLDKLWRDNAIQFSERYLKEGLLDRAASRDLLNGVSIPVKGYEEKKVYVWIEAVAGYYSASKEWAKKSMKEDKSYWSNKTIAYYIHGKDNIPFHTLIWPAILLGINSQALPTHIISNEYLTLEKRKLSTSQNWAVWIPDILERYHPDSIRYFLTINAPENRDTDFSWREFIYSHNSELLGAYGNLVNRTFKFIEKFYEGNIPVSNIDEPIINQTEILYKEVGKLLEKGNFKLALETIFLYIRNGNKYFDAQKPWIQLKEEGLACKKTIATCVYIIGNAAQILSPFLPFSSEEVKDYLHIAEFSWQPINPTPIKLQMTRPLFERIDIRVIQEELEKLKENAKA